MNKEEKLLEILQDLLINIREDVPVSIMSKHLKSVMLDAQEELSKVGKQIYLDQAEDYNT